MPLWSQPTEPLRGIAMSAMVAALPLAVVLIVMGWLRKPGYIAAGSGLICSILLACFIWGVESGFGQRGSRRYFPQGRRAWSFPGSFSRTGSGKRAIHLCYEPECDSLHLVRGICYAVIVSPESHDKFEQTGVHAL
jgi:hypothetical protein